MKIRTDYVSNSSSSSFVLWGKCFDSDEIRAIVASITEEQFEKIKKHLYMAEGLTYEEFHAKVVDDSDEASEFASSWLSDIYSNDIETAYDYDSDEFYIGMNPEKMKDSETLSAFKQRAAEIVNKTIPNGNCTKNDIKYYQGINSDDGICFD